MSNWDNYIDEKKVFRDLFDIYEQEFLTILQYVAPFDKMKVSSNRIHELHMRICAECENLAVKIVQQFISKEEYQEKYWIQKKSFMLEDANNFQYLSNSAKEHHNQMKEILEKMDSNDQDSLIRWIFVYPDMSFYIWELNQLLWLCDKKIKFIQIIEINPEEYKSQFFQPFGLKWFQNVPLWRTHYNSIKHNKITNYKNCTLLDLINSLWAYYMLLNYFSMNIKNPVHKEIKSKEFKPTIWWIKYPQEVWNYFSLFREDKESSFFKAVYYNGKEIIPWYYDDALMKELEVKINQANSEHNLVDILFEESNEFIKTENFFFYNSLEQHNVIYWSDRDKKEWEESLRTLQLIKKFNIII